MNLFAMLSMGSTIEIIGFEDIKYAIKNTDKCILINTLKIGEQDILIKNTTMAEIEEDLINSLLENYHHLKKKVIIYGRNDCDESVLKKYNQILGLGFSQVFVYRGGLFDWLLLQEIYGSEEFPTTKKCQDLLNYRPVKKLTS